MSEHEQLIIKMKELSMSLFRLANVITDMTRIEESKEYHGDAYNLHLSSKEIAYRLKCEIANMCNLGDVFDGLGGEK